MKKAFVLLTVFGSLTAVWAQNAPPPGTISHRPAATTPGSSTSTAIANTNAGDVTLESTNLLGQSNLTFTNQAGATYTVDQLAEQLRNLRASIDQTLPMLSAFNESFSNSATGGANDNLAGAISGILGVLRHKTNQPAAGQNAANTSSTNNLLGVLEKLVTTNSAAPGSASFNPNTLRDLIKLQSDLQPVASTLQDLHVSSSPTNELAQPTGQAPVSGNIQPNQRLSPTGR